MIYKGEFRKMPVILNDNFKVEYQMRLFDTEKQQEYNIGMNEIIGNNISILFTGNIFCINCGRKTKTSFGQGFCYPCFRDAPENSECIIHPERCRAHLGEGRNPEWENEHHNRPHYVYLAATDKVKVGVTRDHQIPTRWIDQGASAAIKLARTPNRYLAGLIEVSLKNNFDDKTDWRSMVSNIVDNSIDLKATKQNLITHLSTDIKQYITDDYEVTSIQYPVLQYPVKVSVMNFDKDPLLSGKLMGIKGQYLLFDNDRVINIRKYAGYSVTIDIS
ncbi:MAG TPA: DUF2797 domain-containing protein [Saprospiraceae bacterium]|mgnify:CR=1 FL=1|jgi:hypothetical protein|nr:DUF2797 domain-containing protein [Saprospiraceae bacterium]